MKANLLDSSEYQGDGVNGAGLPKAIVDEVELFTVGAIGTRGSFFVEQYAVDGGEHGLLRDAWVNDRINPWNAKIPVYAQFGMYTLPLPVDPETFRESYQDYGIYVQEVGNNPFDFFTPKFGVNATVGNTLQGLSARIFTGPGHDRQSGLLTTGEDFMENVQDVIGPVALTYYHYEGERPNMAESAGSLRANRLRGRLQLWKMDEREPDTDWFRLELQRCRLCVERGLHAIALRMGAALVRARALLGTNDTNGFARDAVLLLGYGPSHNARITLEDVIEHVPYTTNTMNLQFTIGY